MRSRSLITLVAAVLGAAACSEADPPPLPPAQFAIESARTELENGLTVFVVPDHSVPTVTALVAFRAGAFVEDEAQSGHSHLLEHMLWKGSTEVPDPKLFREQLRALGALTNATTGETLMTYYQILPRENLDAGLALLAPALRDPLLDADSLTKEIEVVLAEFDRADSDWDSVQRRRVNELLFPAHPNRKDPLGRRDAIRAATPDALRALYTTYYVPSNALLLLIGDLSPDDGAALAERHFGGWASAPDPFVAHPVPEPLAPATNAIEGLAVDVNASRLVLAFQGPDMRTDFRATVAADVLAELSTLNGQKFRSVVGAPAVIGATIRHAPARDRGVLSIELLIGASYEAQAVDRLQEVLAELPHSIRAEQIAAAQDEIWARRFFEAEHNLSLAFSVAQGWANRDLDYGMDYLETLYDIDSADIADLLERYMRWEKYAAVLRSPRTGSSAGLALTKLESL